MMGRAGEKLEVSVEEKEVVVVERKAVKNMAILVLCVVGPRVSCEGHGLGKRSVAGRVHVRVGRQNKAGCNLRVKTLWRRRTVDQL